MSYLVCNKCGGYYELKPGESAEDYSNECECGGKLGYKNTSRFNDRSNANDDHPRFPSIIRFLLFLPLIAVISYFIGDYLPSLGYPRELSVGIGVFSLIIIGIMVQYFTKKNILYP